MVPEVFYVSFLCMGDLRMRLRRSENKKPGADERVGLSFCL
jgi:hypothetical protein